MKQNYDDIATDSDVAEEVRLNWYKKFQDKKYGAFNEIDKEQMLITQNAINANVLNPKYQSVLSGLGYKDNVIFSKYYSEFQSVGAEFQGGVTHVYQHKFMEKFFENVPVPGKAGTPGWGGASAVLRHEAGHGIYENISRQSPKFRTEWISKVSKIKDIDKKLSSYSATKHDEAFCELFATITDKKYDPKMFDPEIRELGQWILKELSGYKIKRF